VLLISYSLVMMMLNTMVQPQALERYGNGYTLAMPDECCLQQWEATGDITSFELGERILAIASKKSGTDYLSSEITK